MLITNCKYKAGYTSCGFQSNLQVQSSLARAVTVDKEVATNSRTLHTLTVVRQFKKMNIATYQIGLMIKISKYCYRVVSLIGLLFIILGLSCNQDSGKGYKVFESNDFTNGDFKLYGFMMEGNKTKFETEVGDFCISDISTLQKMKSSWIIYSR